MLNSHTTHGALKKVKSSLIIVYRSLVFFLHAFAEGFCLTAGKLGFGEDSSGYGSKQCTRSFCFVTVSCKTQNDKRK